MRSARLPRRYTVRMRVGLGLSAFLLLLPGTVSAQALGSTDPFLVSISPNYPVPHGQVLLTPVSNFVSLSNATMQVSVNGTQIYEGSAKPTSVELGGAGELSQIVVTVTSNNQKHAKTLSVRPQDVALVAEPLASAPPLYPGKPLVPLEGAVRVVAIANLRDAKSAPLDPETLSYKWYVDDAQLLASSGIGRDTLVISSPFQYRTRDVSVRIQSQDGSLFGGAALTLTAEDPIIRIYENDPLLGILFDRTLSRSYSITSAEKSLYAAPFSFPLLKGGPRVKWLLNGSTAETKNLITLRPTGSGAGIASLSVVAEAGELVRATTNLSLSFGAARGGLGIFGL